MGNPTTGQNDWIKDKTMRQKEEMNPIHTSTQNARKTKEKAEIEKKTAPAPSPHPTPLSKKVQRMDERGEKKWEVVNQTHLVLHHVSQHVTTAAADVRVGDDDIAGSTGRHSPAHHRRLPHVAVQIRHHPKRVSLLMHREWSPLQRCPLVPGWQGVGLGSVGVVRMMKGGAVWGVRQPCLLLGCQAGDLYVLKLVAIDYHRRACREGERGKRAQQRLETSCCRWSLFI